MDEFATIDWWNEMSMINEKDWQNYRLFELPVIMTQREREPVEGRFLSCGCAIPPMLWLEAVSWHDDLTDRIGQATFELGVVFLGLYTHTCFSVRVALISGQVTRVETA